MGRRPSTGMTATALGVLLVIGFAVLVVSLMTPSAAPAPVPAYRWEHRTPTPAPAPTGVRPTPPSIW